MKTLLPYLALSVAFMNAASALEDGLVGFWSFDEGAGTESLDLAGGANRVVFVDEEVDSSPMWVEGKVGSALHFDEASYAKIENYYGLGGSTPRTISMWLKTDWQVPGGATALVGWGLNENGRRWHFKFEHTTQSIRTENQGGQNFASDTVVTDGEWHHVASVLPAGGTTIGDVQLYVDGVLMDVNGNGGQTVDTATDPDEGAVEVTIGMGFLGTTKRFSLVTIDELGIWERGLSAEEIQVLAEGTRPVSEGDPNLVAPGKASLGQVTAVPNTHEGTFTIRNLGEENVLEISGIDVRGVNPDRFAVSAFPSSLAPGESGEVTYVFDSGGESGGFAAEFVILNNEEGATEFPVAVSASVINLSGPVAHYRLNEAAGSETVNDASGWDRHGMVTGGVQLGESPIAGSDGTAMRVAGGEQMAVPGNLFEAFEAFSVSAWVQPDTIAGTQTIAAFGGPTPDWAVLSSEGALWWFVAGELKSQTDPVLTAGETAHVVVTYAADALALYLNGEPVLDEADPDPVDFDMELESFFHLGSVNGSLPLAGVIDEVQFYNRAISAEDVSTLFSSPQQTLGDVLPVDSDGDGLSDEEEVNTYETDPLVADTDGDGLLDGAEVDGGTDPTVLDTDGGGAWDGYELANGSDPTDGSDDPSVWSVATYQARGTLNSVADAEAALANQDYSEVIQRQHAVINFVGTAAFGNYDGDVPFDNLEEIDGADLNDFVVHATTSIFVSETGVYTFGVNSDDGARVSVSGLSAAAFLGTRGQADTLGTVNLAPGFHEVELLYFERGGGSGVEVFWSPTPGDSSASFDAGVHELLMATAVVPVDSDGDGMDDNWEMAVFGDLARDGTGDEDSDGLTDKGEFDAHTDPNGPDTDGDGLNDGPEVATHNTDPLNADTDGDLRTDGEEVNGDPTSNPLVEDTDGDSFRDGFEVTEGSDPNDASSLPADLLGEPEYSWMVVEALPTYDNFQGDLDKQDVTFRVWIDFRANTLGEEEREMIWESGGGTVGLALVYESDNTLVLRAAGNGGNTVTTVMHPLTEAQLSAGFIPVAWTFDVDNGDASTGQSIALFVDGVLVGEASGDMDPDWTGSNGASFGAASDSFAAGGGNTALGGGLDFASGTLDLTRGLQMFPGVLYDPDAAPPIVDPPADSFAILTMNRDAAGNVQLSFTSEGGAAYHVQHSSDLIAWTTITSEALASGGETTVYEDTDAARTGLATGFYRATEAP